MYSDKGARVLEGVLVGCVRGCVVGGKRGEGIYNMKQAGGDILTQIKGVQQSFSTKARNRTIYVNKVNIY